MHAQKSALQSSSGIFKSQNQFHTYQQIIQHKREEKHWETSISAHNQTHEVISNSYRPTINIRLTIHHSKLASNTIK